MKGILGSRSLRPRSLNCTNSSLQKIYSKVRGYISGDVLESDNPTLEAPQSIRDEFANHPGAAKILNSAIRSWIKAAYDEAKEGYCQGEDLSEVMVKYIPEIERLSQMSGELELAFHLVLFLGRHSYDPKDKYQRQRPSDEASDKLLLNISKRIRKNDPSFLPKEAKDLSEQIAKLTELMTTTHYFESSFAMMSSWTQGPEYVQKFHDEIKAEISIAYAKILDGDGESKRDYNERNPFSKSMKPFVPRIRKVDNMSPGGAKLAFDLVLFLGRHTYKEIPESWWPEALTRLNDYLDSTLLELAVEAREQDPTFKPIKSVEALRCEIAFLVEYHIDSYFSKAFKLLSSWMPDIAQTYALEFFNNIKTKIDQAHRLAMGRLDT
jgi:hypothetical protein